MATAEYKKINSNYKNFNLAMAMSIALKNWRENYVTSDNKKLTIDKVAKAIGERYETIYRLENCGGAAVKLTKYLLFIKQKDPNFDFYAKLKDIMGGKMPQY